MAFNIQKLNKLIKVKKLTYKEIGEVLGVSDKTILNYLKERTKIDVETISKFAHLLGVPVGYFFDEVPTGNINNGHIQFNSSGDIKIKLEKKQDEIEKLKAELDGCRELLKSKDKIIELLEKQIK